MPLSWPPPPDDLPVLGATDVHVWAATLEPPAKVVAAYRRLLSGDEVERAERFHFDDDRRHFITARGVLRVLLGRYTDTDPARLAFTYGEHGKPVLDTETTSGTAPSFNLSHSGTCALIALTADRMIGVDIEHLRPLDDASGIAERFFSEDEARRFRALSDDEAIAGFFNAWTRKEAFVKAVGTGLALPLDAFDVSLTPGAPARLLRLRAEAWSDHPWSLHALSPATDYAAALAIPLASPTLHRFRFSHSEPDA